MCVGALIFEAGKAATAFNIGLGLTAANAIAGNMAARSKAKQVAQQGQIAFKNAENDKRQQQMALAEQKEAKEKAEAQNKFANNIRTLQAMSSIRASEQSGTTVALLLRDQGLQGANFNESINQTMESYRRQYLRNIDATEATYMDRRNEIQSNINEAYNQIPTLVETVLQIGVGGLNSFTAATAIK
jgi:chromatin remodeling complex protein RSC6